MMPLVLLAVIIGVPVLLGLFLRISAIFMFVSVVVGQLLVLYVGDDAGVAAGSMVKGQFSQVFASLFLLLLPLIVTTFVLRHTVSRSKIIFQITAFIGVGLMLYIFLVPILPAGVVGSILAHPIGSSINTSQDLIIGASSLIVLTTMWSTQKHHEAHHRKHHK